MLQRPLVIVIPHEQHGGLVVSFRMVWFPAQKSAVDAQGRRSSRLIAFGRLHIDPAKVQIGAVDAWVMRNRRRELLDGAVPMALLRLDDAQKIFQSSICWKLCLRPGDQ